MHDVSDSFEKVSLAQKAIAATFLEIGEGNLFEVFIAYSEFYSEIQAYWLKTANILRENMIRSHSICKKDYRAVQTLMSDWKKSKEQTIKLQKSITELKEKLFIEKNVAEWKTDPQCKIPAPELLKDKQLAFSVMLPMDTKKLVGSREAFGYYSNKVKEELQRIGLKQAIECKGRFTSATKALLAQTEKVSHNRKTLI